MGGVPPARFFRRGAPLEEQQRQHWHQLRDCYLGTGAIQPAPCHDSPAFLIPKGSGGWRSVIDLRWLNAHCTPLRCRFEMLRALGRLAR